MVIPVRPRTLRLFLASVGFGAVLAGGAIGLAAQADATPGIGCETIRWGFLGSQRRTVCDGPVQPDGSWVRAREVWTPGGYVPLSTYCSRYSCTSSGGYYREQSTQAFETYVVTPGTVLPDEPGHLPAGSVVIR